MVFKLIFSLLFLFFFLSCEGNEQNNYYSEIRLGMSSENLIGINDKIKMDGANPERFYELASVYGIDGKWVYYFSGNKLSWYTFTAFEKPASKKDFDSFLIAMGKEKEETTKKIGKPLRVRKGINEYQDPNQFKHKGYLVEHISWENDFQKRFLEYSLLGGNRGYRLLFTIEVTHK